MMSNKYKPLLYLFALILCGTTVVYWGEKDSVEQQNELYNEPSGPSPKGAGYFYSAKRVNLNNHVATQQNIARAIEKRRAYFAEQTFQNNSMDTWQSAGPNNIGGRSRALVFSPSNAEVIYSAGVSGGIFKSIDGGDSWLAVADDLENLAVVTLAISENQPDTIYAGTGEGHYVGRPITRSRGVEGNGIYVSSDAGDSWSPIAFTLNNADFRFVNKLRINQFNQLIAATGSGLWRSLDSGDTWQHVLDQRDRIGGCLEVEINPQDENIMLASCGNFFESAVYRSEDGGASWQEVFSEPDMGRALMAFAPSQSSIVYLLAGQNEFGEIPHALKGLYRSEDAGQTWTLVTDMSSQNELNRLLLSNVLSAFTCPQGEPNPNGVFGQGWYSSLLSVDPVNPETVWVGAIDLMRSDDGGQNFALASFWWAREIQPGVGEVLADSYLHADQHELIFHPDYDGVSETRLYAINDGGVYVSNAPNVSLGENPCDEASTDVQWQSLNSGYAVNQFYHGAVSQDGSMLVGGMQDNGTYLSRDDTPWVPVGGGDGAHTAFDPTNQNEIYISSQFAFLSRLNLSDASSVRLDGSINEARPFITPYLIDPNQDERLFLSASSLWRSDNRGEFWVPITTPNYDNVVLNWLSAIAVQPGEANNLLAGGSDGFIYRHDAALSADNNYEMPRQQISNGFISSISYHPFAPEEAYATVSTFGENHIYVSDNNGVEWQVIDGVGEEAFPDIPAHDVIKAPEDNATLYVGSDLGVYVSRDRGESWLPMGMGLPNTPVERLILIRNQLQSTLYAFTYGRGAFRLDLNDVENLAPESLGSTLTMTLSVNDNLSIDLNEEFIDRNQDLIVFSASGLPPGIQLSEGILSGRANEAGTFNVEVSASDGDLSVPVSFMVTVNENQAEPPPVTPPEQGGGGGAVYYLLLLVLSTTLYRRFKQGL